MREEEAKAQAEWRRLGLERDALKREVAHLKGIIRSSAEQGMPESWRLGGSAE